MDRGAKIVGDRLGQLGYAAGAGLNVERSQPHTHGSDLGIDAGIQLAEHQRA